MSDEQGPITESPDQPYRNGLVALVKDMVAQRRLPPAQRTRRPLHEYVRVPADAPGGFAAESLPELAMRLRTGEPGVARAILAEAEAAFQEPVDRIESAERRATTLQGAVAVAASVVVAGGSLLLDPGKLHGQGWRIAFAAVLFAFVGSLTACGVRALGATSRIFRFRDPGIERITDRARMDECDALVHRAAELLRSAAVANEVGRVKVGLLRSAAWWFRLAILMLTALAGLLAAYAISGPHGATAAATPPSTQSP
jgi:hypothetical protein